LGRRVIGFVAAAATAFILIVPVELPDKTFVATLMLATRYKPWPVWIGASTAFLIQCVVAVAAGRLINLLPRVLVQYSVAALFLVGAVTLLRAARRSRADEMSEAPAPPVKSMSGLRAAGASFLVLFAAEWGDLSQLLTAGLVAKGGDPIAVFLGSWLGLAVVSGLAVLLGRALLKRVRRSYVRYAGAAVCAALAVITLIAV
jgi:putative Ca2+/H+ antiporter (TMEM165/GDT1 family)